MNIETQYLDLVQNVINNGYLKKNRTGISAKTIAHCMLQHSMDEGFPLMTHRKLFIKSVLIELEGFLKGETDKLWFKNRGCGFWSNWANPLKVNRRMIKWQEENAKNYTDFKQCVVDSAKLKNQFQEEEEDLGPLGYSHGWRNFGGKYEFKTGLGNIHSNTGYDQIKQICLSLKKNPEDRRMVCSGWNPNELNEVSLPCCHILHHVTVIDNTIHLCWFQRSVDTLLGLPSNIASYAALLLLYSKFSGFKPGTLTGFLSDIHIYENHLDKVGVFFDREIRELPNLEITTQPFRLDKDDSNNDTLTVDWTHRDYKLENYNPHGKIKFEVAV